MRRFLRLFVLGIASAGSLSAQVSVEVSFEESQFLSGESVPVAVHVVNHSGQTLHLGEELNWLTLSVESREGPVVPRVGELNVVGAFDLPSSKMATKRFDLAKGFDLDKPGRYKISATVWIRDWDRKISSAPTAIDVTHGATLWKQEFGVPNTTGVVPEVRHFVLQQTTHRDRLTLYVRVTGASDRGSDVVYPLGPTVSFGKPEMHVDGASRLHVLFQTGARSFAYRVVGYDGALLKAETYDLGNSRPRLRVDDQGVPQVAGGIRRNRIVENLTPTNSAATTE